MRLRSLSVLVFALSAALPALAGYDFNGYNPEVIREAYGLTDTALYVGREGLFSSVRRCITTSARSVLVHVAVVPSGSV